MHVNCMHISTANAECCVEVCDAKVAKRVYLF